MTYYSAEVDFDAYVYVDVYKTFDIWSYVNSDADIYDNTATAEAAADAYGDNTFTEATAYTSTSDYSSHSEATAFSATD